MAIDVLVTGGGGVLGKTIVKRLRDLGYTVVASGHCTGSDVDIVWDISKQSKPEIDCAPRIVVHAAARIGSYQQPLADAPILFDVNVNGTLRVVNWCLAKNVRHFLYVSGAIVYGEWQDTPKRESDPVNPWVAGPYAASKWFGELALTPLERSGCDVTVLRLSSLYGPYSRGLLTSFFNQARSNNEIKITPPLEDAFDLLAVTDAARTLSHAIEFRKNGIWNVGSGKLTTIKTIAQLCADAFGVHISLVESPSPRPPRILNWVNDSPARQNLNHANSVTLEQSVNELARTFKCTPV